MKGKSRTAEPEVVLRQGRPTAVILDIEAYRELLEQVGAADDLRALNAMRKKTMKFRTLDEYLRDRRVRV